MPASYTARLCLLLQGWKEKYILYQTLLLKQLLIIWLSLSLYLPQAARYIAYARCTWSIHTASDTVCDCEKLNPHSSALPALPGSDKQKEITQKADWTYLEHSTGSLSCQLPAGDDTPPVAAGGSLPLNRLKDIFHPPRVNRSPVLL